MPFTPSHIAAALPFLRGPVTRLPYVPAALVIGTMIPDVPLFTAAWPSYATTHSASGVLTVDVLATCAAVAVFHLVFRAPLIALLPRRVGERLHTTPPLRSPMHVVWVPVAAAFGAATHAFWDSFTHGRSVAIWGPRFGETVVAGLPLYALLQHLSSVFGLLALGRWTLRRLRAMPSRTDARHPTMPTSSRVLTALALLATTAAGAVIWPLQHAPGGLARTAYWASIGGVTVAFWAATAYCAIFTAVRMLRRRQPAAASTISGLALPPRSETTANAVPSGPKTP